MKAILTTFIVLSLNFYSATFSNGLLYAAEWTPAEAVAFALENNPDTLMAMQKIEGAKAAVASTEAAYRPVIGVHAVYGQTNNPMYSFGNILNQGQFDQSIDFNDPGRTDNLNIMADITYRFYNGGKDKAANNSAILNHEASKVEFNIIQANLAFQTINIYHQIQQATQRKLAHDSALTAISSSIEVAEARFTAGDLLKEDLLNLEVQQARAKENQIKSLHNLNLMKQTFLNLLGLKEGEVIIKMDPEIQELPLEPDYNQRKELKLIDRHIKRAEEEIGKAEAGYYPTVDGFASYQYDKGFELDGEGDSWIAGVRVDMKLYQGNLTKSEVTHAKTRHLQILRKRDKVELSLKLDLEKANLEYKQANERKAVTEKMVEVAQESARLNRLRFKQGLLLSSELIEVEMRLTDALVRQAIANSSYHIAIANLRRASGLTQFPTSPGDD